MQNTMGRRDPLLVELDEIERLMRSINPNTTSYHNLAAKKLVLEARLSPPAQVVPSCGKEIAAVQ